MMYLNLLGLTPREKLEAVERDTPLDVRQEMTANERQSLAIAIVGRHVSTLGILHYGDRFLDLCRRAIEQDEQAAADADKPAPPGIGAESADAKAENYFYHGTRGPR